MKLAIQIVQKEVIYAFDDARRQHNIIDKVANHGQQM